MKRTGLDAVIFKAKWSGDSATGRVVKEILPCPFCGKSPYLVYSRSNGAAIECWSKRCGVAPSTLSLKSLEEMMRAEVVLYTDAEFERQAKIVIRRWNKRK